MIAILSLQELGRLRQAMLLGLARQPLVLPEKLKPLLPATPAARDPALMVLALAGQRQRFERPILDRGVEATPEAARRLHQDPRPIMPEPARRALLRLASGVEKSAAEAVLAVAVRRTAQAGFRLHPFDLPCLLPHIKGDAQCLGLAERAFLALGDGADAADAPTLLHGEITPGTWTGFPKAHRVAFLREERRRHPANARVMLEAVLKSEPAAMRGDLLGALDVGISIDDLPLLESMATDRAESVRTIASELVARVPGTPTFATRLEAAARCFSRTRAGVLSRLGLASAAAVFNPPSSANRAERHAALAKLFDGFSAAEIGAAARLTVGEVIGTLSADEEAVYAAFSARAVRDGDKETMMRLVEARLAADAGTGSPARNLAWLANNLAEPVPADLGNRLIYCEPLQATLQRLQQAATPAATKDDGTLVWTAAVLPKEPLARFLEMISSLPPAITRTARDFAELMLALGRAPTREGQHA